MAIKLILKGGYEGQTIKLNGVQFTDGEAILKGDAVANEGLIKYMGNCYQAFPEGYEGPEPKGDDTQTDNEPPAELQVGEVIEVDGKNAEVTGFHEDGSPILKFLDENPGEQDEKLIAAIKTLDPENDDHWTQGGKPDLAALGTAYGSTGIKRADVDAAIPGYNREQAAADKAAAAAQ